MAFGALAGAGLVAALSLSGRDTEQSGRPAQQTAETQAPQTAPSASPPAADRVPVAEEPAPDALAQLIRLAAADPFDAEQAHDLAADPQCRRVDHLRQRKRRPRRRRRPPRHRPRIAFRWQRSQRPTHHPRIRLAAADPFDAEQAHDLAADPQCRRVDHLRHADDPAPGSSAHICTVEGRDLSEVVLFNGGGRASSEATPDLAAAEDHARTERLGVWKR
jgi:hypothetical protein